MNFVALLILCAIFLLPPSGVGQAGDIRPGVIEGSRSYPGDFIPPDLTVVAVNPVNH